MRSVLLLIALFISSVAVGQEPKPFSNPSPTTGPSAAECKKADTYALDCVVQVVQVALMNAQTELEKQKLPLLKTVDLDFKTIVQKTVGGGINFWIFSIGATHEKDVTNDVSFQWSKPQKLPSTGIETFWQRKNVVDLGKQLTDTVVAASRAIHGQSNIGGLPPTGLTVTVAYAVQNTVSGGVSVPIPTLVAVTPSLNGKYQNNNTQTIKLTFENQ